MPGPIYRCPTRKQNQEYVMYLLKVLYLESNVSKTSAVANILYNYSSAVNTLFPSNICSMHLLTFTVLY